MRKLRYILGIVFVSAMVATSVFAFARPASAQANATATVNVNVPARASVSLERPRRSPNPFPGRGSETQIIFDKYDDVDRPVGGDPRYMFAPYITEAATSWHILRIVANGSSIQISASVTGTIGTKPLSEILGFATGGIYELGSPDPIPNTGTPSGEHPYLNGWTWRLNRPVFGEISINRYRLIVQEVGTGAYTGTVTFTLTSG